MAIPSTPVNFYVQQGNGEVLLTWDLATGATSYDVQRSTDNITYASVSTPSINQYVDTAVTVGTQYWYKVASVNGSGTSAYSSAQSEVPTISGQITLGQLRLLAQQRADRVNSNFVTKTEWNSYINQSAFELYDLLITTYEDYYLATPFIFATNGSDSYPLPDGISVVDVNNAVGAPFYKLYGVDLGLASTSDAWVTLKKYDQISRNRFVFPQLTSTYLGVFNLRYRLMGNSLWFIPTPSAGQYIRVWYFPRMTTLLADNDILDSVSGWSEYIIVDAAIKALQKEESDVSVLMQQKMMLIKRIEESAMNRDAGQPDSISDSRSRSEAWGGYGAPNGDGGYGGY
jgi:hypothetical protein